MPAFPKIGSPQLVVTAQDEKLNQSILNRSVALGRGLAETFMEEMLRLVRAIIDITPPNTGKSGKEGLRQGKQAIDRDLQLMGFVPVEIKGVRTISFVPAGNKKGAKMVPITPVQVKTKENPKFADPDSFHAERIARKREKNRSRASRGGAQAFYVRRSRYGRMRSRLQAKIGELAAPWIGIAQRLNNGTTPNWIPAWIRRHEAHGLAHTAFDVNFDPKKDKMFIHAVNETPGSVDPKLISETQRRIEAAKVIRANTIERGLKGRAERILSEKKL